MRRQLGDVVGRAPEGTSVVLFAETPKSDEKVPQCLAEHLVNVRPCAPSWPDAGLVAVNERLAGIAATRDAEFLDVTSGATRVSTD